MSFEEGWDSRSKLDKLGVVTYSVLLIGFLVGLIYLIYFSGEFDRLREMLSLYDTSNPFIIANFIYFVLILLGVFMFSGVYQKVVERIFYPETKEETLIKQNKKEYEKKYPAKIAELKLIELKAKLILDYVTNKIKEKSA